MNTVARNLKLPNGVFGRADLLASAQSTGDFKETQLRNLIEALMESGRIVRLGRGHYTASRISKPVWVPPYSEPALEVVHTLDERFPLLNFRVWELTWLNEFLNHLIARNTIFACVEADGCAFAFDALADELGTRVLLRPSPDDLIRYGSDGTVAIIRLVTEPPKARTERHRAVIEQVVVDMLADKLVRSLVPEGDIPAALADMFTRFSVDQVALFRYARRRNREAALRDLLVNEAGVELYA